MSEEADVSMERQDSSDQAMEEASDGGVKKTVDGDHLTTQPEGRATFQDDYKGLHNLRFAMQMHPRMGR